MGDFDEQFVELGHQEGKRDMIRAKALRCRERKYGLFSQWDEIRSDPRVEEVKATVKKKRKREFKINSKALRGQQNATQRAAKG